MSQVKFDFFGKNFIITGASSGMGKQITLELAEAGAKVLAIARNEKSLVKLHESFPENIFYKSVDVCDYEKLYCAVTEFVGNFGKINGAIHAAGILGLTPLRAFDREEAHNIMNVSFWGAVNLLQACNKVKLVNEGASFVLFSSAGSYSAQKGLFSYAGSKAALRVAAKSFAKETAKRKIRINTVSPGWVNTSMTNGLDHIHNLDEVNQRSLLGVGEPSDVSGVVLFLLSDRARWITGTDIVVDGGYLA